MLVPFYISLFVPFSTTFNVMQVTEWKQIICYCGYRFFYPLAESFAVKTSPLMGEEREPDRGGAV